MIAVVAVLLLMVVASATLYFAAKALGLQLPRLGADTPGACRVQVDRVRLGPLGHKIQSNLKDAHSGPRLDVNVDLVGTVWLLQHLLCGTASAVNPSCLLL
jgi:hypothetical protein